MNDILCGMKTAHKFISLWHNPRVWQTDRRTGRRTERPCNTVRCVTGSCTI